MRVYNVLRSVALAAFLISELGICAEAQTLVFSEFWRSLESMGMADQQQAMKSILPGTRLIFSNGKEYTVGSRLGDGGTTVIYEIRGRSDSVLRLPAFKTWRVGGVLTNNSDLINATVDGYSILNKLGVSTVDIISSSPNEYVEVSRLPADAVSYLDLSYQSESVQRSAMRALADFADEAAAFDLIGDFNEEQAAYSPSQNRMILFDWLEDRTRPWNTHQLFSDKSFAKVRSSPQFQRYLRILNLREIDGKLVGLSGRMGITAVPVHERIAFAENLERKIIAKRLEMQKNPDFLEMREAYWRHSPPRRIPVYDIHEDDPVTTRRMLRQERPRPLPLNNEKGLWARVCSYFKLISPRK